MADFDLDIRNYSINDLETFFKLKKNYTESDIEYKEYEIREQLISSGHVDKRLQKDLIDFLKKAKEWLVYAKFDKSSATTEIPNRMELNSNIDRRSSIEHNLTPASKSVSNTQRNMIEHPERSFVYTNSSDVFQGSMNPLNTRFISQYVTIDTRMREDQKTNTSDFTIQLPTRLKKVVSMQLSAIEIPTTYFNISKHMGNNFLFLRVNQQMELDGPSTNYETVITIPDGFYTESLLITTINTLLCPRDENCEIINVDTVFSYVVFMLDSGHETSNTNRVTVMLDFKYTMATTIKNIELDFRRGAIGCDDDLKLNTKLGWVLGFTKPLYTDNVCFTGELPMNINTIKYIYLSVNDYQQNVNKLFMSGYRTTNFEDNVLARVSIKPPYFRSVIEDNFNLITEPRKYFGPVDIQKLHIQLFDDYGQRLNTNDMDFSFVLLFKMIYDL